MKAADAYADLRRFGKPVMTSADAALRLRISLSAASRILAGLAKSGLALRLRRGKWTFDSRIDPLALPEYLTTPHPAYVSFQSALYLRGMISQIPRVTYVASLGRTRRVKTALGTYSIHRLPPELAVRRLHDRGYAAGLPRVAREGPGGPPLPRQRAEPPLRAAAGARAPAPLPAPGSRAVDRGHPRALQTDDGSEKTC